MSSLLYRLGRRTARHARLVLLAWVGVLLVVGGVAAIGGGQLRDDLSIPGTESQDGLDVLATRFPQLTGTTGQVVYVAPPGSRVTDYRAQVEHRVSALEDVRHVELVADPFDKLNRRLAVSDDGRHALVQVQLDVPLERVDQSTIDDIARVARDVGPGPQGQRALQVHLGGQMYTTTSMPVSFVEGIGLVVALVVLVLTLGSLLAAGIPLLTAILGVGITMGVVVLVAATTAVNSSTPSLAMMIGLAVGIDYALLLASRHRLQLAEGMAVEESVSRSVATAGSAVIFAGVTVMIALCGLVVARIPFLSVMGVAAAGAVAVAVAVAVTLVPALLSMAGERLRPKEDPARRRPRRRPAVAGRWVGFVTRRPVLVLAAGAAALLVLAMPAKDLTLGLPDTGYHEKGSTERETYDLVSRVYGPGFNGPLLVVADIIRTRDPVGVMHRLGRDIGRTDGVQTIGLTTPNRKADLGIVQVVPEHTQTDPRTADLVRAIRARAPALEQKYGVTDLRVTGQTAVAIDVSDRLAGALLPFGVVVVGLSLLLLMVVFRSIAIPVKATLGYLLSVAASFGAVVLVFQHGVLADVLNVEREGPVLSFLPIMLMGVLFGLAMDYEVFLVARMREHWVHSGDALASVTDGFRASARVVTAAAVIMVAVFTSFVPHGDASVKQIAFGLAVGVLVDAFVVRMTLVPAVLALLGERAWRLPGRLDRHLPSLDVEGEGLTAHLEHERYVDAHGPVVVRVEGLVVRDPAAERPVVDGLDLHLPPGGLAVVTGDVLERRAVLGVVCGRLKPDGGRAVVLDRVLPDEAGAVRSRVAVQGTVPAPGVRARHGLLLLDVATPDDTEVDAILGHCRAGTAVLVAAEHAQPLVGAARDRGLPASVADAHGGVPEQEGVLL